jgi:uncharacterized repeat protein (TIGR03847 family)
MTEYDLGDIDRFTAGTVGEPGARTFFVQAVQGNRVVTLKAEKQQVAALARYLAELLADLPPAVTDLVPHDLDLAVPIEPDWTVGQIGVLFDEDRDRVVVRVDELGDPDDDDEDDPEGDDDEVVGGSLRVTLTREQTAGFCYRATELVASGRPPCPLCRRPMDPDGHTCIKTNGHLPH